MHISNPKRNSLSKKGLHGIYPYYASFSPGFVKDILASLDLHNGALVLDPWNGSGTTTKVASSMCLESYGGDINPVMVFVAKAKTLDSRAYDEVINAEAEIKRLFISSNQITINLEDPLCDWFTDCSVIAIRTLESVILSALEEEFDFTQVHSKMIESYRSITCLFYVTLFRVMRAITKLFGTTNPTWLKKPHTDIEKINISFDSLIGQYIDEIESVKKLILEDSTPCVIEPYITVSDSRTLKIADETVSAIVTSPPYCTRIDYIVSTSIELALLWKIHPTNQNDLRSTSIGTPKVIAEKKPINKRFGQACCELLNNIEKHPTKASSTYYYKTYVQYFESIYLSISEIARVLKRGGYFVVVVQDSYYKELIVDLSVIISEICSTFGLTEITKKSLFSKQNIVDINRASSSYKSNKRHIEHVVVFVKGD